jgi:hypothetical protein
VVLLITCDGTILPIFRSIRLCDTASGIMHWIRGRSVVWKRRNSSVSRWYNALNMWPAGGLEAEFLPYYSEELILWHHGILLRTETAFGCIPFCVVARFGPQCDLLLFLLPGAFYVFFPYVLCVFHRVIAKYIITIRRQRPQTQLSTGQSTSLSTCFGLVIIKQSLCCSNN